MKKQLLFIVIAIVFVANNINSQIYSGYLNQGFESTTFPPTDWQTVNVLGPTYQWAISTVKKNNGLASAFIRYDTTGGEDWLITPQFHVGPATDKVTFAMLLAFAGYAPDQLAILVSTTDALPASFTTILLNLQEGTNYPTNTITWTNYEASLAAFAGQDIYIAFKQSNTDGDGLYIDDISIGTKPSADVTVLSIDGSSTISSSGTAPMATVKNNGSVAQDFSITATSTDGYSSTMPVVNLAPDASIQITFANWSPLPGSATLTVTATLAGDVNLIDNTLNRVFNSYASFPNNGWITKSPIPAARWAFASTAISNVAMDDASVFAIGGGDAAFANSVLNQKFSSLTNTWVDMATMPTTKQQVSAQVVGNKIYVPGGYSTGFTASNQLYIYDITTGIWSTGANLLTAVGDYAIASYNGQYIYVIGGYDGAVDVNTVQVYDIVANTWSLATPKLGTATAGLRGGIANGKLVVAGGYSQTLAGEISEAVLGTINPSDPLNITWTSLPAVPTGTVGRASAGGFQNYVYFTGGDPTGAGTAALTATYAYNVTAGQWELGPNKPTAASNLNNFSPVVVNGRKYLVSLGGYNGTTVSNVNEWLDIGCTLAVSPGTQSNVSCNGGFDGSATVAFVGGTGTNTYSWAPSGGNAATATGLVAGTYTVTVSDAGGNGCSATQSFNITEPAAVTIDLQAADSSINSGDSTAFSVSTTNADSYQWQISTDNGITWNNLSNGGLNPAYTGADTSILTLTTALSNSNGNLYRILVRSGICPATTSNSAMLTVLNVLAANDDDFNATIIYAGTGGNAGNVLPNDMVNGAPANAPGVTLTLIDNAGITGALITATGDLIIPATATAGNYTLTYSLCDTNNLSNCNSATIQITVTPGLATNTFEASSISVYPNPALNEVFVKVPASASYRNLKIIIYDMTGRQLMIQSITSDLSSVNISRLPSEAYLFNIISDNGKVVKLIVKK